MSARKPKLNLDIFSDSEHEADGITSANMPPPESVPDNAPLSTPAAEKRTAKESPRFVPVGFYPEHLRLLDDTVHRLRQQGYWQASKSGIIRRLIEKHSEHLEEIWLAARKNE